MSNCKAYSAHPALALEQLQCAELFKNQQQQHRRHNSSNVLSRKISTHSLDVAALGNQSPIHEIILPDRTFGGHNDIDVDADADNADDYLTEGGHNYAVIDEDELLTTTTTTTKDCVNCANNFNDNEIGGHDNVDVSCCTRKPIRSTTMTTSKSHDDDDDDNDDGRIRNSQSPYRVSLNRHHLTQLQQHLALGDIDVDGVVAAGRTGCLSGVSSTISSPSASTVSTPLSTPTRLPLDYTPHHHHHNHHHQFQHNHLHQHHQVPKCNHHYNNKNNYKLDNSSALAGIVLMGGAAGTATRTSTTTTTTTTTGTTTITLTPQLSKSLLETSKNQQPHPQHYHHQHHNFHHSASSSSSSSTSSPINKNNNNNINNNNGCKKIKKFDPRLGPSPYRQLLPIALCILSFAVVFSLLIIYMDTTGEFSP